MGWKHEIGGREAVVKNKNKKDRTDIIKKRDKGWRVSKKNNKQFPEDLDIETEYLRLQGLIRCIDCDLPYSLELTECPHCIKNNKYLKQH